MKHLRLLLVSAVIFAVALPVYATNYVDIERKARADLTRGDSDAAIRTLDDATAGLEDTPVSEQSVSALRGIADQYRQLGARSSAIPFLEQALDIASQVDPRSVDNLLLELGNTQGEVEDHESAKATFKRLAESSSRGSQTRGEALVGWMNAEIRSSDNTRGISIIVDDFSAVTENVPESTVCELSLKFSEALLKSQWANDYSDEVRDWLQNSLELAREEGNAVNESLALGLMGEQALGAGYPERALNFSREALLVAAEANRPDLVYRWQWHIGRAHKALGDTRRAIEAYESSTRTLAGIQGELLKGSFFAFKEGVQPVYSELASLLLEQAQKEPNDGRRQALLVRVQESVEGLNRSEVLDYFDNDCVLPRTSTDLASIERDTAVIYPLVLDDRLTIIAKLADGIHYFSHDIEADALRRLVQEFRFAIEDVGTDAVDYQPPGAELYDLLIRPLESSLDRFDVSRLVFVPSATFRTIPMSALFDGEQHLIQRFEVVTTLGLELTDPTPSTAGVSRPLLGGISQGVQGFTSLPGVIDEIDEIESTMGGDVVLNEAFTVSSAADRLSRGGYSTVHLATHGVFNAEASNSYLLAFDDKLTLDQLQQTIGSRRFLGEPLELLVLSACETAAGDERAALGLAGVSLKAGARTTVASLWAISDDATAELMTDFYRELKGGAGKAAALRRAQLNLLEDPVFNHPNFWSAFLLIGNWQ